MKKFLIIAGIIFAILFVSAVTFAALNFSTDIKKSTDNIAMDTYTLNSGKPVLALFYADWCTYCIRFIPKYKSLSNTYKNDYDFIMLNIDNPVNKPLMDEVGISSLPTVYIIDPKYDNRVLLNNAIYNDTNKMKAELERYLRIRHLLDLK